MLFAYFLLDHLFMVTDLNQISHLNLALRQAIHVRAADFTNTLYRHETSSHILFLRRFILFVQMVRLIPSVNRVSFG